jgi:hypothetical protein
VQVTPAQKSVAPPHTPSVHWSLKVPASPSSQDVPLATATQDSEQQSPSSRFPSSQASPASSTPSPQIEAAQAASVASMVTVAGGFMLPVNNGAIPLSPQAICTAPLVLSASTWAGVSTVTE